MTDALNPCPFCGGENLTECYDRLCIACLDCGCDGPVFTNTSDTIAAWNTRAPVKVKPLAWGDYPNRVLAGPDVAVANVDGIIQYTYQAQRDPCAHSFMVFAYPKYGLESWSSNGHTDIEAAKAAAQADYKSRILAALDM